MFNLLSNSNDIVATIGSYNAKVKYTVDSDKCYEWLNLTEEDKTKKKERAKKSFKAVLLPTAPDGGWGWFVDLGAFGISMICDGIVYSFGVLYSELLLYYKESKSKTSFMGSVFFGVSMTFGPVASVLTSRFGSRTMAIVGGLLSSLGMFLSCFAYSLDMLFLTFGIIVGAGFCCCYIASVNIVNFYFDKRRSLATGIAVCGKGIGTITFAPFIQFLIEEYALTGLFLILSGVCLNLVVFGMLFRPLKFTKRERLTRVEKEFENIPHDRSDIEIPERIFGGSSEGNKNSDTLSLVTVPEFAPEHLKRHHSQTLMTALHTGRNPDITLRRYMINTLIQVNYAQQLSTRESSVDRYFEKYHVNKSIVKNKDITLGRKSYRLNNLRFPKPSLIVMKKTQLNVKNSFSDIDAHGATYLQDTTAVPGVHLLQTRFPLYRSDIFYRQLNLHDCTVVTSCPQLTTTAGLTGRQCTRNFAAFFKVLCDCSLFHNYFMVLYLISNFIFFFWIDVPYMYATDYAVGLGIEHSRAVLIVSLMGVAITVGHIIFGYIGDRSRNVLLIYASTIAMAGVLVAMIPFARSLTTIALCYVPLGLCISANCSLVCELLVHHLGLDRLTQAFGLLMMTQGVGNFIGPMVAGWISDVTGSYHYTFYSCGFFFTLSGVTMYLFYLPKWYTCLGCCRSLKYCTSCLPCKCRRCRS